MSFMHYFAGLFDAEGYVTLNKDGRFHIGTEMSNEEVPNLFKAQFGGNIYARKRDKRKPTWAWIISTNRYQAISFIDSISAHCVIKNTQLLILKDYLILSREKRRELRGAFSHSLSCLKNPLPITKQIILDRFIKEPTIEFFQWLAGFFDGDGNFCVYEYKGKKCTIFDSWISVFNTHGNAIAYVHDRINGSLSTYKGSKFPIWKWVCSQKQSIYVCENVLPYLKVKREQCVLVMSFLEIQKTKTRSSSYSFEQINQIRDIIKQIKHLNSL